MIRYHALDLGLLSLASVAQESQRVKDWALDLILLRLALTGTTTKATMLVDEDAGSVHLSCFTFHFMRLKLYTIKTKKVGYYDYIRFLWASMI